MYRQLENWQNKNLLERNRPHNLVWCFYLCVGFKSLNSCDKKNIESFSLEKTKIIKSNH